MIRSIIITIALTVASSGLIANDQAATEDPVMEVFRELDWKSTGTYKLPGSHSVLSLPANHYVVLGKDADRFSMLNGNTPDESVEAITIDEECQSTVYFESYKDGYVSLNDWEKIDSKQLLQGIIESTEEANKERRKNGASELHVTGWVQEPTLDRQTNTVYWAIEASNGSGQIVNSIALRLSRHGYERLVWVAAKSLYVPFGGELDIMLRSHSFDRGYRYTDYVEGDKIASYGIAALVAATVGGKIVKAGGLAFLLKKVGGFLVAGAAAVFYKIRQLFNTTKCEQN